MATWLFKTEPSEFSFAALADRGPSLWDGVRNATALGHLRRCAPGDLVLIYHTGQERAVVGLARVVGGPIEDPASPGRNAAGEPKHAVVTLEAVRAARVPVTLAEIKADKLCAGFDLVRLPRLSVMPVPAGIERRVRAMAGL